MVKSVLLIEQVNGWICNSKFPFWCVWCASGKFTEGGTEAPIHVGEFVIFCIIRKVAGSIPAGVIGIFHILKIRPIALWSWGRLSL